MKTSESNKSRQVPRDKTYWLIYNVVAKKYPEISDRQIHAITCGIRTRDLAKEASHA